MNFYVITKGRVGENEVTEWKYYGRDSGLSHYLFKGKKYFGTVEFSEIYSTRKVKRWINT